MDTLALAEIVKREVADYARPKGLNASIHFMSNDAEQIYSVLAVLHDPPGELFIIIMAQVIGEVVVIYRERTDPSLYETLLDVGIPRSQIVRVALGEKVPEPIPETP